MFRYETVIEILKREGKTREWLALQVGTPKGSMNQYLSGHRQPSIELLARMAKVLKHPISGLVEDPPDMVPAPKQGVG